MVWVATLVAKRNGTRPCLRHVLLTHANMSRPNIHEPVQSHDAFLGVYQPVSLVQFVYTRAPLFGASPYLSLVLSLIAIMAHVLVTRYHISIGRVLTYMEKVLSVISQHLKKTKNHKIVWYFTKGIFHLTLIVTMSWLTGTSAVRNSCAFSIMIH